MGVTVYSPTETFPAKVGAVIVEARRDFASGSQWELRTDLEFVMATAAAGGQDMGRAEMRRRIGRVKLPQDGSIRTIVPDDLIGWWVRARLIQQAGGDVVIFVGQVESEAREVLGGDVRDEAATRVVSETRTLVAYSPRQLLRKIDISESIWQQPETDDDGYEVHRRIRAGWMPDMNGRDQRRMLTGNRSARPSQPSITDDTEILLEDGDPEGSYLFGGTDFWSRRQFAEYILNNFVNRRDPDDMSFVTPYWRLAGQADLLDDAIDFVSMSDVMTADDILRALIQPKFGVDWFVRATDEAFEIVVFALLPTEEGFGTANLPANPNRVEVRTRRAELRATVVQSRTHRYSRIRIIGARGVLCCSLESMTPEKIDALQIDPSLVGKWSAELEAAYRAGTGQDSDTGDVHDLARGQPKFDPVYQHYGAPTDWRPPVPKLLADGEVVDQRDLLPEQYPQQQRLVRRTLPWIPLKSGVDYSEAEAVDRNPPGYEAAVMQPMVWLYAERDPSMAEPIDGADTPGDWIMAERAPEAISVRAARHDWGVVLSATPNHILGRKRFDQANLSAANDTQKEAVYNPGKVVATIAIEIDQRLMLEHQVAEDDGSVMTISMPDAEVWHLADQTVVGVSPEGLLHRSGPKTLRNDAERMFLVMAGAIARYENDRARAELVIEGWAPWAEQIGHILTRIENGSEVHELAAPISSIEWLHNEGKPRTVVKTGYAR